MLVVRLYKRVVAWQRNLASKVQNTSKTFEDFLFPAEKNME